MAVELSTETLTEEGGADGAVKVRRREKELTYYVLTSSHSGGCYGGLFSPSSSDSGDDSDGVYTQFPLPDQSVCTLSHYQQYQGYVSGRVGDGIGSSSQTLLQSP